MSNIIKGDDLMLFDSEGKSIAFATSHTLTITANSSEINSKDQIFIQLTLMIVCLIR